MTSFRTIIELDGKTATGMLVPAEVVEALGSGRQPLVMVTVNGHAYRSRIAVRGGAFKLPISAEHRAAAGVTAGDEVEVTVALDTAPRELAVPPDLQAALAAEPAAADRFAALSFSRRQRFVLGVEGAKTDATRARRVAKAVADLKDGKG